MFNQNTELLLAFAFSALPAVLMLICVPILRKVAKHDRNALVGVRTEQSFRSQRHWEAAQYLGASYFLRLGIAGLIGVTLTFLALLLAGNRNTGTWWIACLVLSALIIPALVLSVPLINRKLRNISEN
jgi:uncharacterized membrane protein